MVNSEIVPRDICGQAADALRRILRSYSELYSLYRTPTFVSYFVRKLIVTHLALGAYNNPSGHSTAISDTSSVGLPETTH